MGNNKYTKRKHGKRHSANKGNVSRRRIYRMRGGDGTDTNPTDKKEPTFMDTVKDSFGEFTNQFTGKKPDESATTNTENMDVSEQATEVKPESLSESMDIAATETEVKPDTSVVTEPTEVADNSQELATLQQENEQLNNQVAELTREKEEAQEIFADKLMKALMKLVKSEDSDEDNNMDDGDNDTQENPDNDSL